MTSAIIFGITGQDGFYLNVLLKKLQIEVIGVARSSGSWLQGDVADFAFVSKLIKKHQPDYVFHLAANSTTRHEALFENHVTISTGTLNILESVRLSCPTAKVFLSGSALQFKNEGLPIDEQTVFAAQSPYAVSRIQSVYAARYYRQAYNLKVYVGYFFNHDSVLRTEQYVNQKIVAAVNRIAKGSTEKLVLGNIDVKKEFNYAGDIVEAIWKLVNQDLQFEAVIGCGQAYSIRDWVEYCFKKINKTWTDYTIEEQNYIPEYKILVSNPKLIKALGWQPKVTMYDLADKMLQGEK